MNIFNHIYIEINKPIYMDQERQIPSNICSKVWLRFYLRRRRKKVEGNATMLYTYIHICIHIGVQGEREISTYLADLKELERGTLTPKK